MYSPPVYKQTDLYSHIKKLVQCCYEIVRELPEDEQNLSGQKLRLAALTAYAYIVKALTRKSRKKLFRKARLELFVVDSLLDLYKELQLLSPEKGHDVSHLLLRCFELLKKQKPENKY